MARTTTTTTTNGNDTAIIEQYGKQGDSDDEVWFTLIQNKKTAARLDNVATTRILVLSKEEFQRGRRNENLRHHSLLPTTAEIGILEVGESN